MIQKPSIGRIVHYTGRDGSGPYAAIVTEVDGMSVALTTFGKHSSHTVTDVPYLETLAMPTAHTWRWPPRE